jgi:uncharacterized damage-inducible protein DinB
MKRLLISAVLLLALPVFAQDATPAPKPVDFRTLMLQELHETHNQKNWFVSGKDAVAGLTAEQSNWTQGKGNHSVGQLLYHLNYWNAEVLHQLQGEKPNSTNVNNDDTFTKYDSKNWDDTIKQYDEVMSGIEKVVESADEAKLPKMAAVISRVAEHNAYHIGEMVVIRKLQGSWNPEQGVK